MTDGVTVLTERAIWSVNFVVLVILAAMWAAVLVPRFLGSRQQIGRRRDPVRSFRSQLTVLGRTAPVVAPATRLGGARPPHGAAPGLYVAPPRPAAMPATPSEAGRRRRDVICVLAAAAVVTLGGWYVTRWFLLGALHVAVDLALAAFATLVVQHRRTVAERAEKVRSLGVDPVAAEPRAERQLVRTSSGG